MNLTFLVVRGNFKFVAESDVEHILLPLNFHDADGGKRQFLVEMYLRLGLEFMVRAFSDYGEIQKVFNPRLYLSDVSGVGRPLISLSIKVYLMLDGEKTLVRARVINPEELYFIDWDEPDVKVANWKCFFDQLKNKVKGDPRTGLTHQSP